jgi:hypothetical protein
VGVFRAADEDAIGRRQQVAKLCDRRRSNGTLGVEVGAEVGQSGDLLVVEGDPRSLGGESCGGPEEAGVRRLGSQASG